MVSHWKESLVRYDITGILLISDNIKSPLSVCGHAALTIQNLYDKTSVKPLAIHY